MKDFSVRGFLVGVLGLLVITSSSMYVALRLGALPWPTVFVTILSMTILTRFKNSTIQEINVCHTLMSAGSMVAGGLAFTLPGLWILNSNAEISFVSVLVLTICGAVLGTLFSWLFREKLVIERQLVFPIGNAAFETLKNGLERGKKSIKLFISMGISVVITILRDVVGFIPSIITLFNGSQRVEPITMWISPMAMSIGALIDKISVILWAAGTVLSYFIMGPLGMSQILRQSLGIGLMLGTGVGILIKAFLSKAKDKTARSKIQKTQLLITFVTVVAVSILLAFFTSVAVYEALFACMGICLVALLSGLLTGQSGINPMEIFGIIVTLCISFVFKTNTKAMFVIAGVTAVACGLSGDVMNDFKSGYLLGTNPKAQMLAEAVGGVLGAVVATFALFIMKNAFGSFGTESLPAPQAVAVASMIGGFGDSLMILVGMIIGCIITVCGISAATLGLGIYLSVQISSTVCLGAVIAAVCKKAKLKNDDIILVSSGLLGGEGVTGMVTAIISMF